jgi:hypothetical protein
MLTDDLKKISAREQIIAWDRAEAAVRSELTLDVPARSLSADVRDRFSLFEKWCTEKGVRRLPCKPWVVAAFILSETANGRDAQSCMALLAAIEAAHDSQNLSNPVVTAAVRQVLEKIIKSDPPGGWRPEEKAAWTQLPADVRAAISRCEAARDKGLRQAQNKLANERHALAAESALAEKELNDVSSS